MESSFKILTVVRRTLLCMVIGLSVACGRPDADVQAAVRAQLANDPVTAPLDLSVEVKRGVVRLSGETRTAAEQAKAIEIARSIEGVSDVISDMRVADAGLVEAIKKAFAADPVLASVPIEVDSRDGAVRLMSDQTNREQRERAVAVAKRVEGVKHVEDLMK